MSTTRQNASRDATGTPSIGGLDGSATSLQTGLSTAAALPRALMEVQLAFGSELIGFIGQRMQAQAELFGALSQCREFSGAIDAQRRFNESVVSDYSNEFDRLTEVMRKETATLRGVLAHAFEDAAKPAKAPA